MAKNNYTSKELIEALRRIGKYGKSKMTLDLYMKYVPLIPGAQERLNHGLAVAELMSRLAPEGREDEWYLTGLLHEILEISLPNTGNNRQIILGLLEKAKINRNIIQCIQNAKLIKDPRKWTPLMTALIYADTHADATGDIMTTEECCLVHKSNSICEKCMYARYIYSQLGMSDYVEQTAYGLKQALKRTQEKYTDNPREEEGRGVQKQRRVGEEHRHAETGGAS